MKDIIDSLFTHLNERLSSRYLGYLSMVLALYNYDKIIIIFSDKLLPLEKIQLIRESMTATNGWVYVLLVVIPFGLIALVDYCSVGVDWITQWAYGWRVAFNRKRLEALGELRKMSKSENIQNQIVKDNERFNEFIRLMPIAEFENIENSTTADIYMNEELSASLINSLNYLNNNPFISESLSSMSVSVKSNIRIIVDYILRGPESVPVRAAQYTGQVLAAVRSISDSLAQMKAEIGKGL